MTIDSDELVPKVAGRIDTVSVKRPRVAVSLGRVELGAEDTFEAIRMSGGKTLEDLVGRYPLPNLIDVISHLLQATSPPVRLTRQTLLRVFEETNNLSAALENPQAFATAVASVLREYPADQLIDGIEDQKLNEWYQMRKLDVPFDAYEEYLVPSTRSPWESVQWDSHIERDFVKDIEDISEVKLYIKLPDWFTVDTPVGKYNPDWAIVWEDRDEHGEPTGRAALYLVRETKGTTELDNLQHPNERRKVICGTRHFQGALGVDYKVVTSAKDLP